MKPAQVIATIRAAIRNCFPLLIKGSPGIGKSDMAEQATKAENMPLVIRHPVIEESIDYKGLPGFSPDGIAKFFPFADFHTMLCADAPTVVFFDDLGQAPQSVQAALMQVILARQIGGKAISPHVRFLAATNSRKDGAGVAGLLSPLVSRFTVIEAEADANDWVKWALAGGMPVELPAFIRFRPELISTFSAQAAKDITPYACPRSIAQLGKWIKAGIVNVPQDLPIWSGTVGDAFATEFAAFYATFKALAGLPDQVITNPQRADIPEKLDVLYALTGALAHRANNVNFASIATYGKRLAKEGRKEFETALVTDCTSRNPDLCSTQPYIIWATENQGLI